MDHEAFKQTMQFAFQDVRREICLARASKTEEGRKALLEVGVEEGGGNFIAALALLCCTEFAGNLWFKRKKPCDNFNCFFDEIGPSYKAFRSSGHKVYDIFRCGLAHEFNVKKSCTIYMFGPDSHPGIGQEADGKYYLVVERYCLDLERAFVALEARLFPEAAGNAASHMPLETEGADAPPPS